MIQKIRPDMNIGESIKKYRMKKPKMTQNETVLELSLRGIEMSKSTYAKIETNRMNIKVSELKALSKIFDCEIGDFFEDLED